MMIQHYRSTDTNAPVLNGQAGSLIALLQAILVDGYHSTTVTLTCAGSTVTVYDPAHGRSNDSSSSGFHDVIEISGAAQAAYNGKHKITWVDADHYTFTIASTPATPATGTITAKKAPVGWTVGYTGTNRKSWKSPTINRYVEILENTNAVSCTLYGYSTMSASGVGTDALPVLTIVNKSTDTGTTASHWIVHVVDNFVYLFLSNTQVSSSIASASFYITGFGEFYSDILGDEYNFLISSNNTAGLFNITTGYIANVNCTCLRGIDQLTFNPGICLDANVARLGLTTPSSAYRVAATTSYLYPDTETGTIVTVPHQLWQTNLKVKRGVLQGVHFSPQPLRTAMGTLKTIAFTEGTLAGKELCIMPVEAGATYFLLLEMP